MANPRSPSYRSREGQKISLLKLSIKNLRGYGRYTHILDGYKIQEQRLDVTRAGDAEAAVLISMDKTGLQDPSPEEALGRLRLELNKVKGLVSWSAYNAVLDAGNIIAYLSTFSKRVRAKRISDTGEQELFETMGCIIGRKRLSIIQR